MAPTANSATPAAPPWPALAAIGLAWLAGLAGFLAVRLPNAGGDLTRAKLLLYAIPGISYRQAILAGAAAKLSQWAYLPQRLPIVGAAALIAGAAVATGLLILRSLKLDRAIGRVERPAIAFGLGVGALGVLTLIAGRLGVLTPWTARVGLALPIAGAVALRLRDRRPAPDAPAVPGLSARSWLVLGLVIGPFLVTSLLAAMLPTIDFDALEYHVQGPKEYFQGGRIAFLPHNVYTSMPFGVEMLHLLGMHVLGDWWSGALAGQVLIWAHAPAAALLIAATAFRLASPRAAWVAAVVYLATPWIYRLSVLPYVEGPLAYFHAALVWAIAWSAHREGARRVREGVLLGLLAGGAFACKYPALISAVIPFGGVAVADAARRRSAGGPLGYALGVLLIAGPWLAKNVIDHRNPVYPLGYSVFGGQPWDDAREAKWSAAHGRKPVTADELARAVVDVAGRSDWQSPLYAALAPLAFLRPGSRRAAGWLAAYVLYLFATWWLLTHRLDRFWLPMLPVAAALAGLGADWARSRAWAAMLGLMMGLSLFVGLVHCWTDLTAFNEWTADLRALRSSVPRMLNRPLFEMDRGLPPDAKILLVGQAAVFHVEHPIAYNTVFDDEILETVAAGRAPGEARDELIQRGFTHIYVDWFEIDRHRRPGGYGFTPFVTPELLAAWSESGVLGPPMVLDPERGGRVLYEVRRPGGARPIAGDAGDR